MMDNTINLLGLEYLPDTIPQKHPCFMFGECKAAEVWGGYPRGSVWKTGACEEHAHLLRAEKWGVEDGD